MAPTESQLPGDGALGGSGAHSATYRIGGVVTIPREGWSANGCLRYRLAGRARQAKAHGASFTLHAHRHFAPTMADVTIDLRPTVPRDLDRLRPALAIADYDDLLFADQVHAPAALVGARSPAEARRKGLSARQALRRYSLVTVSTSALAEEVRRCHARCEVVVAQNDLDPAWIRQGRALYPRWRPGMPRCLRYLPGSTCREADVAVVAEPLRRVLARHPEIVFEIVGSLDLSAWPELAARALRRTFVPFDHLAELYSSAWATIAPLAATRFNACKSAIKFSEAAAFGAPCVATPIPAMRDIGSNVGKCPLLAQSDEEWESQLERLCDDDARGAMSDSLESWADREAHEARGAQSLYAAIARWRSAC